MPDIIPGYTTEQKILTVSNNDNEVNAAITAQAVDSWVVSLMTVSGSDMVILFSRTIAAS